MAVTYREMLRILLDATSCQLDQDMTVYNAGTGEFHPVEKDGISKDGGPADGILDSGHLYLEIKGRRRFG